MPKRRMWVYTLMFVLAAINYIDRSALSVAATPLAKEFGLDPVELGYLFSSFLWLYVVCLVPMGMVVDKLGSRTVNALGIGLWSAATVATGAGGEFWRAAGNAGGDGCRGGDVISGGGAGDP